MYGENTNTAIPIYMVATCDTIYMCCAGIGDLKDVLDMVVDVGKKWMELGLALGLKQPTLDKIHTDKCNVSCCKREMLSKWLNWVDGCEATCNWQSLATALRNPTVDHAPIADTIERKYSIN